MTTTDTPALGRLTRRAEFLSCSKAPWRARPTLVVQMRDRGDEGPARLGITASKKVGNAVARNRAKRRLRALARDCLAPHARPGHDYVLVARPATPDCDWASLQSDLGKALSILHR